MDQRDIRSRYLTLVLSPRYRTIRRVLAEVKRLAMFKRHKVHVFLQLDDPYSYLLSHYLLKVQETYKVQLHFYLSGALRSEFMPQPALQAEYALADCKMLAREFGLPMLDKGEIPAVEFRRPLLDFLAEEYDQDDFVETFSMALECYWRGDPEDCARLIGKQQPRSSDTDVLISKNQLLLRKLGHYSSAVMLYAGEWYWGVDRLHYLTSRLDALRLRRKDEDGEELASLEQAMQMNLPAQVPAKATSLSSLEMFYSFRSPYSYLALKRMYAIANAFGLKLEIRPVLPMVMRGLPVPKQKQMYIIKDANREAERNGIAFGKIFDPLGQGVERCLAVLEYAREQSREREFLLTVGHATWALGIDIATDEGMRRVTEKAGLFWPDVMAAMQDEAWKARAEENGESMLESGIWGVPCLRIGSCALWGQDRTWLLARQIEDMCQDGDGILT